MILTASNLVRFIKQLNDKLTYNYINPRTPGAIRIIRVNLPEGPIEIKRWNPNKGETESKSEVESISREMIWRIANAFRPNLPLNFDRILAGSYNTRSVLEALLAHTPEFYNCYPGRIEIINGISKIKKGHKHLIWLPEQPHRKGMIETIDRDISISEIPSAEVTYEALIPSLDNENKNLDIDLQRRHAQIQIALYHIGKQLNYKIWIAQNDKGIMYKEKRLGEYEGVVPELNDLNLLYAKYDAIKAANLIDCIWFKNGTLMPAVIEIEHPTGVTRGLSRMKNFQDKFIRLEDIRWVVVAEDADRDKVIKEASKPQFHSLKTKFFPYSAVEELYWLCQKRKLKGITEQFLDCFMEPIKID